MVEDDPTTDEGSAAQGPIRQPSRADLRAALNLFEWVERFAENHGSEELDESELDELWTAIDTILGTIDMGQVGHKRMNDLINRLDSARGAAGKLDFLSAARCLGPVIARLKADLEEWPFGVG